MHFAINGDAYVRLTLDDGTTAYTRAGSLEANTFGEVTVMGRLLDPPVTFPPGTRSHAVLPDGTVIGINSDGQEVIGGQLVMARFTNPAGLQNIGGGLYIETPNIGDTVTGTAGTEPFARLLPGQLEGSNIEMAQEMVEMLVAQRMYSNCAKAFSVGDEMLRIATDLTQ
jgi:flagellar basal body rod protein FlgG